MKQQFKILLFTISTLIFIGIDWSTKNWARENIFDIKSDRFRKGILKIDFAENNGAFLSLGSELSETAAFWFLQIFPATILIAFVIYIFAKLKKWSLFTLISFSAIFAGGTANLIDRFSNNRYVVDFMVLEWGGLKTGIFNFADVFISIGVIGLLISNIFFNRQQL